MTQAGVGVGGTGTSPVVLQGAVVTVSTSLIYHVAWTSGQRLLRQEGPLPLSSGAQDPPFSWPYDPFLPEAATFFPEAGRLYV